MKYRRNSLINSLMERTHSADFIQIRNKRAKTSNNDLDKEINPGAAPLSGTSADFTETERAAVQLYKVSFQDYLPEKQLWGFVYWWKCRLKLLFCGFVAQWLGEKGYSFSSIVSELSQITSIIGDSGRGSFLRTATLIFVNFLKFLKLWSPPKNTQEWSRSFVFTFVLYFRVSGGGGGYDWVYETCSQPHHINLVTSCSVHRRGPVWNVSTTGGWSFVQTFQVIFFYRYSSFPDDLFCWGFKVVSEMFQ